MARSVRFALLMLVVLVGMAPISVGWAAVPDNREQITLSFAPVVKRTAPAVVNIFTKTVIRERPMAPFFDDPIFRRFFGGDNPFGMPSERVQNTLGSGVIVQSDGLIITNDHVIKGADQITVVLSDRREFEARVVLADPRIDLAVLRIAVGNEKLPALELRDSDEVEVGDLVLAIGNPFGVGQTVTSGIVSAVARTAVGVSDYNFFLQTDAAINPGNSGGPLVTMDGRIAGINTAIFSKSGGSIGIGFAIPANMVRVVLAAAVSNGGTLVRPWLGLNGQAVTAEIAGSLGLPRPAGVLVKSVSADSPAGREGVRVGDVLLTLNGHPVDDPDTLRFRVATLAIGSAATVELVRAGEKRSVTFTLIAPPEDPPRDTTALSGNEPLAGASVANLSPAVAEEINFEGVPQGVVILAVAQDSFAAQFGFRRGDVVVKVNDIDVSRVSELRRLVRPGSSGRSVTIRRDGQVLSVEIRW